MQIPLKVTTFLHQRTRQQVRDPRLINIIFCAGLPDGQSPLILILTPSCCRVNCSASTRFTSA